MDIRLESVPSTRALTFTRTFEVADPDVIDYFGGMTRKAALDAGVEPSGPLGGIMSPPDANGRMRNTFVIPTDQAPDRIALDATQYLVEEGDALEFTTLPAIDRAAVTRVEGPFPSVTQAVGKLRAWAVEHGYRPGETFHAVIVRGPMHHMPDGKRVLPEQMIWDVRLELFES